MKDSMDGRWRDVMTVVSGRGDTCPERHVLLLEAVMVTRLSVTALLKKVLMKVLMLDVLMRKVKVMMMGVFLFLSSSLTRHQTTTTQIRACSAH